MPGDESARLVHPLRLPALVGRLRPPGGGAPETEPPVSVRAPVSGADFAALLPDVARRLLGDPPRATGRGMVLRLAWLAGRAS